MLEKYIQGLPNMFDYIDCLVVTDKEGYIEFYKVFNPIGNRIIEDPVGLHILDVHQHLTEDTSTVMKVLREGSPVINEKQYLNIFKERTLTVLSTTLPLKDGDKIIGAVDINKYFDSEFRRLDDYGNEEGIGDGNLYFTIDSLLTKNPRMKKIKERTLKAAKTDSPVMIYGETGTGKELIAQAIHNHSFRKSNPYIIQNCSAIPLTLGESIFFGTTRGSFTGAENKKGLFEMANNGTLVLDELNSMDIELQAKLLRATENNYIRRVGGDSAIKTDVRIISTLNEEPSFVIEESKLRQDLYYRLGVVLIYIPPLRERKEDIPLLVENFIKEYNSKMNKTITGIDDRVKKLLQEYNWPGNVRELKHIIESAFNFADGDIISEDELPSYIRHKEEDEEGILNLNSKFSLNNAVKEYERKHILLALEGSHTLNEAAKILKISRQTLKYKMDTYGIRIK